MTQRTWLITGVSSGLGREIATQLLESGDLVVGTVRRPDAVAELAGQHPDTFRVETLDVTDRAPAETFTGDAWVDHVVRGEAPSRVRAALVRFAPGARNAWHSDAVGQSPEASWSTLRVVPR